VNARADNRSTPLHLVLSRPRPNREALTMLLDHKAFVDARDTRDNTPLHLAASLHEAQIIQQLIAAGADPNTLNRSGQRPIHCALESALDSTVAESIKALIAGGADPNALGRDGLAALHRAAKEGSLLLIETLLDAGADPNVADGHGRSPLSWAAQSQSAAAPQIAQLLLTRGAIPLASGAAEASGGESLRRGPR
jgi:ankyrin repeat protein